MAEQPDGASPVPEDAAPSAETETETETETAAGEGDAPDATSSDANPDAQADASAEAAAMLAATQAALSSGARSGEEQASDAARLGASDPRRGTEPATFEPPSFGSPPGDEPAPAGIELLSDVDMGVSIELGRAHMLVDDVLKLAEGCVIELDKLAGDPVDIFVNGRHIARGEVLVLNDNFCVRVSEILAPGTETGLRAG